MRKKQNWLTLVSGLIHTSPSAGEGGGMGKGSVPGIDAFPGSLQIDVVEEDPDGIYKKKHHKNRQRRTSKPQIS